MRKFVATLVSCVFALSLAACAKDEPASVGDINTPENTSNETAVSSSEPESSEAAEVEEEPVDKDIPVKDNVPAVVDAVCAITEIEDYTEESYVEYAKALADLGVTIANENDVKKPFLVNKNTSGDFAFGAVLTDSSYARDASDDRVYTITMNVLRATSATGGKASKTITHNITTLLPSETDAKYIDTAKWTLTLTDSGEEASLTLDTPDWCE